jgi:CTP-dependent riboflavin kinase
MKTKIATIVGMIIALALPVRAQNAASQQPVLIAHLLIYSGLPDPKFVITDQAYISNFFNSLNALPVNPNFTSQSSTVVPSILGYKGIYIENFSNSAPDIVSVVIYGANVEIRRRQQAAANGAVVAPLKEFHRDSTSAPNEASLFDQAQSSGVLTAQLQTLIGRKG